MAAFLTRAAQYVRPWIKGPAWLQPYIAALVAVAGSVALANLLLTTVGAKGALVYVLLYLLLIGGAAWLGYGPGVLVCTLTTFVVPRLLVVSRSRPVDLGRFGLLLVISLLISRLAASKRKTEQGLRLTAEELEKRVRERTLELESSRSRLGEQAQLLDLVQDAILAVDAGPIVRFWNRGAEHTYGWTSDEAIGKNPHELLRTSFPDSLESILSTLNSHGYWQGSLTQKNRSGEQLTIMSRWTLRRDAHGAPAGWLEINTDVTEHRRVEEQLRHSQRLESVGQLAGGVAHDFNNLLTVINGYAEMLLSDMPAGSPAAESLMEIRSAGDRAAGLTQQLLAFSRKQLVQPAVLNLNTVVADVQKMVRRLIGENIQIVAKLDKSLGNTKADPGQLHQIIVNLAVNARDAMPNGGTLVIETANMSFDESYVRQHPEVQPGPYVMLAVTDSGTGMTEEVRDRLFEPFFTTKPKGAGTGLGLATVYGMVKQIGGWIWVYSELGHGSSFKIYLPQVDAPVVEAKLLSTDSLQGDETILVVEDQAEVRTLTIAALRRYGYTVMGAASGEEALALCAEFTGTIDLVLTDVIMPGMTGPELSGRLTSQWPGLQVLFVSGYPESAISHRGVLDAGVAYLQKPFTPESLAERIRTMLGPRKAPAKILIVDDDPGIRRYLRSILAAAGYAIVEAGNGKQAVNYVKTDPHVDLVITDLVMPEQEGLETIAVYRKVCPNTRILAISGAFRGDFLSVAMKLGAHGVLPKPIGADDLLRAVEKVLAETPQAGLSPAARTV